MRSAYAPRSFAPALAFALLAAFAYTPAIATGDSASAISCDSLHVSLSSDKNFYVFSAAAGGDSSVITGYTFDYGDRQSYHFTFGGIPANADRHTANVTHAYQTAGTYTASVRVNIKTQGKDTTVTSAACKTSVTVEPPADLPDAGAGLPLGLAAAVTAFTAGLTNLHQRRRLAALARK